APGELNGTYLCGGAIINRYYVVTAAHCLFNPFGIKRGPDDLKIGVADHNQFSTKDDIKGATAKVSVRRVIIHEDFYNAGAGNDIALLKLEMPLDLASYPQLKAVCLPRKPRTTYENATGTVYGWGTTEKNYFPQAVLRETSIPILNPECENKIIGGVKIKPEMLCAGLKNGGKDSCAGDSGGPLTVEENRRHTLVGITSFGVGCGLPDTPGVYTRMTAYLDWIMDKTKDSTYCN
ncbi:Plasma kallikrein, partial [Halocaridina rubra]